MSGEDITVIQCNFVRGTSEASTGSRAYVLHTNGLWNNRICLLIRSRSGRWIRKWENLLNLGNFRLKTMPPEHPRYQEVVAQDERTLLTIEAQLKRATEKIIAK